MLKMKNEVSRTAFFCRHIFLSVAIKPFFLHRIKGELAVHEIHSFLGETWFGFGFGLKVMMMIVVVMMLMMMMMESPSRRSFRDISSLRIKEFFSTLGKITEK